MLYPVKKEFTISSPFYEMRPLTADVKTHPHGAIDIACPIGTEIIAPEKGSVFYHFLIRYKKGRYQSLYWDNGQLYAFRNYFYDTFGGLIILEGEDTGFTHVFAHIYINQLFNKPWIKKENYDFEEVETNDIFSFNFISKENPVLVQKGEKIGESGSAGFSTGPHIHYEIHQGRMWDTHAERVNPELLYSNLHGG